MSDADRGVIGGRYQVIASLGKGGMGQVYKAYDPVLDRTVALKKMIATVVDSEEGRQRFYIEARAAARLNHPNIVTIHELEEYSGDIYIVMELLDGVSLAGFMRQRVDMPLAGYLTIIAQIAEGLHYAHKRAIVHRDIKPANLVLTTAGNLKILDFGIARLASSELTKKGKLLGTPHYMAPEQVIEQPVDARADLFSLGAVAYELVTGVKPFAADSIPALLMQITSTPHRPVLDVAPDTDPSLAAIIDRLLAKDRTARFLTGMEVVAALDLIGEIDRVDYVADAVAAVMGPSGEATVYAPIGLTPIPASTPTPATPPEPPTPAAPTLRPPTPTPPFFGVTPTVVPPVAVPPVAVPSVTVPPMSATPTPPAKTPPVERPPAKTAPIETLPIDTLSAETLPADAPNPWLSGVHDADDARGVPPGVTVSPSAPVRAPETADTPASLASRVPPVPPMTDAPRPPVAAASASSEAPTLVDVQGSTKPDVPSRSVTLDTMIGAPPPLPETAHAPTAPAGKVRPEVVAPIAAAPTPPVAPPPPIAAPPIAPPPIGTPSASAQGQSPASTRTDAPIAAVPPSAVPPSALPRSAVPPSALPPSAVPPSGVPPSAVPPWGVPPSAVPPSASAPIVPVSAAANAPASSAARGFVNTGVPQARHRSGAGTAIVVIGLLLLPALIATGWWAFNSVRGSLQTGTTASDTTSPPAAKDADPSTQKPAEPPTATTDQASPGTPANPADQTKPGETPTATSTKTASQEQQPQTPAVDANAATSTAKPPDSDPPARPTDTTPTAAASQASQQNQAPAANPSIASQSQTPTANQSIAGRSPAPGANPSSASQNPAPAANQTTASQSQASGANPSIASQNPAPGANQSITSRSPAPGANPSSASQNPAPAANQMTASQSQASGANQSIASQNRAPGANPSIANQNQAPAANRAIASQNPPPDAKRAALPNQSNVNQANANRANANRPSEAGDARNPSAPVRESVTDRARETAPETVVRDAARESSRTPGRETTAREPREPAPPVREEPAVEPAREPATPSTPADTRSLDYGSLSAFRGGSRSTGSASDVYSDSPSTAAAVARITYALDAYGDAIAARDLDALRDVRSPVTPAETTMLKEGRLTVRFSNLDVSINGSDARVRCQRSVVANGKTISSGPSDVRLTRRPEGWVITDIR